MGVIIGVIILAVVVLIALYFISSYNSFVRRRNNVEEAFSTMDVYLKKRYDLIPNLVSTVKGYAKHEKETLQNVIAARNMAISSKTPEEKIANENALQGTLKNLFAVAESYPDLKADKSFINLQETLNKLEAEIANSRKYYNGVTKIYNVKVETFPSNIIAGMFKFSKKPLFEVEDIQERKNVKVEF